MNLLEYVQTLSSDISIAEKIALTKAWKDKNEDPIEQGVIEVIYQGANKGLWGFKGVANE